ncbi:MAG: anthranilate synthase component I family protein [Pedobacter sp.]|nr:MAG: anthranilate synthase component I family protein [Pedobacter sp.]
MNRESSSFSLMRVLNWLNSFSHGVCLDSNGYKDKYSRYDFLIAAGVESCINSNSDSLAKLKNFHDKNPTWMFGFISYNLKNELEELTSNHPEKLNFPHLYFFVPKYILGLKDGELELIKGPKSILSDISKYPIANELTYNKLELCTRLSKDNYFKQIESLKQHIKRGDIYEITFAQEFYAENAKIDPLATFVKLKNSSPAPFSSFFKMDDRYILSASPERYLAKFGKKIISQPIKGTAKRGKNPEEDNTIKLALRNNPKELAENVMIVDLVRNDLTRCAKPGTVKVDELFGLYTFPHVHQLISTISCELAEHTHFLDAIKVSFPMGSMTGAPKIKAMKLIENFEMSARGAFSGSIGYIDPNEDFDFNVLIRSIFYNENGSYISIQTGGAITDLSNPDTEYEETLIKAEALLKILT